MEEIGKHYQTLKYMGKELKREGEKNGNKWKIFALKFDVGMDYPKTVSFFDSALQDKDKNKTPLEEGDYYTVGFEVKEIDTKHGKKMTRQGFFIKPASESEIEASKNNNQSTPANDNQKKDIKDDDFKAFEEEYKKTLKDPLEDDANKFVLTWFLNKHSNEFMRVLNYARNR